MPAKIHKVSYNEHDVFIKILRDKHLDTYHDPLHSNSTKLRMKTKRVYLTRSIFAFDIRGTLFFNLRLGALTLFRSVSLA